jgi:hypothetical protein
MNPGAPLDLENHASKRRAPRWSGRGANTLPHGTRKAGEGTTLARITHTADLLDVNQYRMRGSGDIQFRESLGEGGQRLKFECVVHRRQMVI